jgi:iron complex transport system substrate-binding protein
MIRFTRRTAALVAAASALAACGQSGGATPVGTDARAASGSGVASPPGQPALAPAATAAWSAPPRLPATVTDSTGQVVTVPSIERLISLGGSITETVYALGLGGNVAAADSSSSYPPETAGLARVAYVRTLAAEGILSLNPSAIVATEEAGPPAALEQLRGAGVPLVMVPDPPTLEAPAKKISMLAAALGVPERGRVLLHVLEADLALLRQRVAAAGGRPRVLFLYVRAGGTQSAAGLDTQPGAMIEAAGGINAGAEVGIVGYKPITAEAVVAARPDVLLAFTSGLEGIGGVEALLQIPGLAQSPAGQARRVVHMDDLYLGGMGPRTGKAALELAEKLRA